MVAKKLSEEDCKHIIKLINEGHQIKEIAKQFGVHPSLISMRCKGRYLTRMVPLETRNKVIKAIKEGSTMAEAAQMYDLNIGTVYNITRGIVEGHHTQGNHIFARTAYGFLTGL